jgi:hypothetical protein
MLIPKISTGLAPIRFTTMKEDHPSASQSLRKWDGEMRVFLSTCLAGVWL